MQRAWAEYSYTIMRSDKWRYRSWSSNLIQNLRLNKLRSYTETVEGVSSVHNYTNSVVSMCLPACDVNQSRERGSYSSVSNKKLMWQALLTSQPKYIHISRINTNRAQSEGKINFSQDRKCEALPSIFVCLFLILLLLDNRATLTCLWSGFVAK